MDGWANCPHPPPARGQSCSWIPRLGWACKERSAGFSCDNRQTRDRDRLAKAIGDKFRWTHMQKTTKTSGSAWRWGLHTSHVLLGAVFK